MTNPLIQDVSDTAIMVAAYRARETGRAAPLFRDPLAARLAGEKGNQIVASLSKRAFMDGWSVARGREPDRSCGGGGGQ